MSFPVEGGEGGKGKRGEGVSGALVSVARGGSFSTWERRESGDSKAEKGGMGKE